MKRIILLFIIALIINQKDFAQVSGGILMKTPLLRVAGLENVPYNFTPPNSGGNIKGIALFLSGDGGWYYFEQAVANHLAENNIATIGFDTKKYFWSRKTPEQTAEDISKLLSFFGEEYNSDNFILMGYSQGAEIVPFVFNLLPELIQIRVISIVLLSPETTTDFEIHVSNMVGLGSSHNTYNVIQEIRKITGPKQIVIFGEEENTKVPELLKGSRAEIVKIPGDHHYKLNSSVIVEKMKTGKAF